VNAADDCKLGAYGCELALRITWVFPFDIFSMYVHKKASHEYSCKTNFNCIISKRPRCVTSTGPFKNLNSEQIEQELGDMFRVMYKMGKAFADQPIPRNAADKIRRTMEKFKTHQALLNVICNPGIRERHWVAVRSSCQFVDSI
jgi:Dynein heavy chain, N-terminal region 2